MSWRVGVIAASVGLGALSACTAPGNGDADAATDASNDLVSDGYIAEAGTDDSGGPVMGPVDMHCGADGSIGHAVDPLACFPGAPDGGYLDGSFPDDAGGPVHLGVTMYGASGDDDDCKYHIVWLAPPPDRRTPVTFDVTITSRVDGSPVLGANPRAEAFLNDSHQAPLSAQMTQDVGSGIYEVGPVWFNASGDWTVRFHLFEQCVDGPTSPRAHAAFYVHIP